MTSRIAKTAVPEGGRRAEMKTFFFMGRNPKNKSGVSWKVWKVERDGRAVTTWWGPARVEKRRVVPTGALRSKTVRFPSAEDASDHELARIHEKRWKGYEQRPRRRL